MISQNKIKHKLALFLSENTVIEMFENCRLNDKPSYLDTALKIDITEVEKGQIRIRLDSNTRNGISELTKTYKLNEKE